MDAVVLKPGKERSLQQRHHWIFSGAIQSYPQGFSDGDIVQVRSSEGKVLGSGYFHRGLSLAGRMLAFGEAPVNVALRTAAKSAHQLREALFVEQDTNAFRLVNGEGDGLPGLVVDRYADVLVAQFNTLGIDRLKLQIVEILATLFPEAAIFENSNSANREVEGLEPNVGWLRGNPVERVHIRENGLKFLVDLVSGQKTGFFLDQREMRRQVREYVRGRRVLNCFSYTGGFTVAALAGQAARADSVDISAAAMGLAQENVALNGFAHNAAGFFTEDVFTFLRNNTLPYDFVILDPPAFAKRRQDVPAALRGYRDINRLALEKLPPGSFLLTSSCSYNVDERLFQKVVFQAALQTDRTVRIIGRHRHAPDHPINIFHPETDYLKSLLLFVE